MAYYNRGQSSSSVAKDLTILLLGETGVGKSTFINAFVNYMAYDTMDEAAIDPICLIPVSFTVSDQDTYERRTVTFGQQSDTENTADPTKSATKFARCYKFTQSNGFVIKIIDTPGIGDTAGVDTDQTNMKNLLFFVTHYKEIDAICVLLKPNNARVDVVFKYCLLQLFSHLNKTAANNILFLFTNARSTQYAPGESGPALQSLLTAIKKRPPNVDIPYNKSTVFCFDNEAFRYLVAKSPPNCMTFDDDFKKDYENSWQRSVKECKRLLDRISALTPHKVQDTVSLNNAKQNILMLNKPLGDIAKNIADNMKACELHKRKIHEYTGNIAGLKRELYVPSLDIKQTPLDRPKTVCSDRECTRQEIVNGNTKIHYVASCHYPCQLPNIPVKVIGDPGLKMCAAFNGGQLTNCHVCGHTYVTHLHITYDTEVIQTKVRDETKANRITTDEEASRAQQRQIQLLETKMDELSVETDAITKAMARFACFLKHNALTPFNDAFEDYIKYLIKNEKSGPSEVVADNSVAIQEMEQMLDQYNREKLVIMKAINESDDDNAANISPADIDDIISDLFELKHNGRAIKEALDVQKQSKDRCHKTEREIQYKVSKKSKCLNRSTNLNTSLNNSSESVGQTGKSFWRRSWIKLF